MSPWSARTPLPRRLVGAFAAPPPITRVTNFACTTRQRNICPSTRGDGAESDLHRRGGRLRVVRLPKTLAPVHQRPARNAGRLGRARMWSRLDAGGSSHVRLRTSLSSSVSPAWRSACCASASRSETVGTRGLRTRSGTSTLALASAPERTSAVSAAQLVLLISRSKFVNAMIA